VLVISVTKGMIEAILKITRVLQISIIISENTFLHEQKCWTKESKEMSRSDQQRF
jgi:hypothetical protein